MEFLNAELFKLSSLMDFHFIRPWLLSFIPVAIVIWLLLKRLNGNSQWQQHLPKAVIQTLQIRKSRASKVTQWAWLVAWVLISFAAAGPSWLKQAVPVVQNQNATVIVLDLSLSMLAKDLTPDRLTLAKYKLIDVLRRGADGQMALIVYSGDAYTVSPLTDDPNTIESLLPALNPNLMPTIGSNVEAAIAQANSLLKDAGVASGHILLLTDGIEKSAYKKIEQVILRQHSLSILGIGSNQAAPIPLSRGGFIRKADGDLVLADLNARDLQKFASTLNANLNGRLNAKLKIKFTQISTDDSDLNFLMSNEFVADQHTDSEQYDNKNSFDAWVDMGHWLVLLILPIFLILFRKGLIYSWPILLISLAMSPSDSYAASTWDKLWKNPDQIGAELIAQKDYSAAQESFKSQEWSAVAAYKSADYATTIEQLEGKTDVTSLYNSANALALNGEIDNAIEHYQAVLKQAPEHAAAKHNLDVLKKLKQQQDNQQQQKSESNSDKESSETERPEQSNSQQQNSEQTTEQKQQENTDQNSEQKASEQDGAEQEEKEQQDQASPDEQKTDGENSEDNSKNKELKSDKATDNETEREPEKKEAQAQSALEAPSEPLKDSSEQWLRSIEDNPSGFLRRKFQYQTQQRQQQGQRSRQQKDDSGQQRY